MDRFISPKPLEVPASEDLDQFSRADLVFYGVEHAGASYEARVFIDNPDATTETSTDLEHGYAGSYTVFGHAGCYGEEGHCHPEYGHSDAFDRRPAHPLTPYTKTVVVTEALLHALKVSGESKIAITVVPVIAEARKGARELPEAFRFTELRLLTYADPAGDE